jgi:hypothetical protein
MGISLQVWMLSYHWENAPEQTLQQLCLLRSEGQTLKEVDYILHQPHGEYQQEHLKNLQELYETQKKLLGEHDRGEIPLEFLQEQFNTLQKQFNTLQKHWNIMQKHWNIMQKLRDIENNPENFHLTSEQQENLQKTVQGLQESNKCCYDNYCEGLKNLQNLQKDQEDKHDEIKVMKKYCDIQEKMLKFQIKLTSSVLSRAERENWKTDDSDDSIDECKFSRWSSNMVHWQRKYANLYPKQWDALLDVQSSTSKKYIEIVEKQQKIIDYAQENTHLLPREQEILQMINKVAKNILGYIDRKSGPAAVTLNYYSADFMREELKSWDKEFQRKKEWLEALEKYPKILDQLRQTGDEMAAQMVLEVQKNNLEKIADNFGKIYSHDELMQREDCRVKLDKALEEFSSSLTDSLLSPKKRETHWKLLQMWKENLDSLDNVQIGGEYYWRRCELVKVLEGFLSSNPSSKYHAELKKGYRILKEWSAKLDKLSNQMELNLQDFKAISRLRRAYDDWEKGTASTSSNTRRFNWKGLF